MALGDLLTQPIESGASTGLIAAIADRRGIREIAAAGVRKAGCSQALLTTDAIHIGSNTKAMTATMLATLVDGGVFPGGWDTTIADVFPELLDIVHPRFHPVDLWQLVTMAGGIKPDAADWHATPVWISHSDVTGSCVTTLRTRPPPCGNGCVQSYPGATVTPTWAMSWPAPWRRGSSARLGRR